jgi:hypothetical protein
MTRPLRRRDFLVGSVTAVATLAAVKAGGRWLVGVPAPSRPPGPLAHLDARRANTVVAAALAMVGPRGEAAYEAGRWDPAADVDRLLGGLAAEPRAQLLLALVLFEEWTLGISGFSSWDRARQRATLAAWRTSRLGLQRSVWGFLHAACCSSFSGIEAGWEAMGYPGPFVGTERAPGQTVAFTWDEAVP